VGMEKTLVKVGAGNNWDEFVSFTISHNIFGLENISGIPGTVGGMIVQNAGAYGVEIKDYILSVEVYNIDTDQVEVLNKEECSFSYRSSLFKNTNSKKYIIIAATFILNTIDDVKYDYKDLKLFFSERSIKKPTAIQVRQAVLEIRGKKMPDLEILGCAGSFFKNVIVSSEKYQELIKEYPDMISYPETHGMIKLSLAWILDKVCNLKGFRDGNVGLYENQPLVLVNYGGATCNDILNFAKKIKKIVKEKINIDIEWEVEEIKK
jgi:UDP-N-acetylmuramate dehydrogenase